MTYKTSNRYATGWVDPTSIFGIGDPVPRLKIGDYVIADLFISAEVHDKRNKFVDLSRIPALGMAEAVRVRKEELAAVIEAFLQGKKDGESTV